MLTDFHIHVLPGIDDGSPDTTVSGDMLSLEASSGIRTVIATPHFYATRMSASDFIRRRSEAYRALQQVTCGDDRLPDVTLAAEVFYFPGMGDADFLDTLCAGKSRVLFLEMPFDQWSEEEYNTVRRLTMRRKLDVVLVHIERFLPFQKKKDALYSILDLPVTLQINAGSLLSFSGRHQAKKILSWDKDVVLGSDAHNMGSRKPNMAEGVRILESKFGQDTVSEFEDAEKVLMEKIQVSES